MANDSDAFDKWASAPDASAPTSATTPDAPPVASSANDNAPASPAGETSFEDWAKQPSQFAPSPEPVPEQPGIASLMYHATGNFLSALGTTTAEHIAKNMRDTGEIPSLGGYLKQAGQLGWEGLKQGEQGLERAGFTAATPVLEHIAPDVLAHLKWANPQDFPSDAEQFPQKARLTDVMNGAALQPGESISNLTQRAAAEQVNAGPIGEVTGMKFALLNVFSPLFSIAEDTYRKLNTGSKGIGGEDNTEANIDSAVAIGNIVGLVASPHLTPKEKIASIHWDAAFDEATYMGTKPKTPAEQQVVNNAQILDSHLEVIQKNAGPPLPAKNTPAEDKEPDIHTTARSIAPQVFGPYDAAVTRRNFYGDTLRELAAKRDEAAAQEPPAPGPHDSVIKDLNDQISKILGQVKGVEDRLTKTKTAQLADLRDKIAQTTEDAKAAERDKPGLPDTPDMAVVREAWHKENNTVLDLSNDVKRAYEAAAEHVKGAETVEPQKVEESAKTSEPATPTGETPKVEEATPKQKENQAIIDDVAKRQVAAGRPVNEAMATAHVTAAFFQKMSELYEGKKGSASDWYKREGTEIKRGKSRGKTLSQKEGSSTFNQRAKGTFTTFADGARSVIKLFQNADASTFLHESAHHFLDVMSKYADMDDAPQALKDDYAKIREYVGAKEGEGFKPAQHEMFARSFEQYCLEGTAPSRAMAGVFAKFKAWLNAIYDSVEKLKELGPPINDSIRGVFARMLSPETGKTFIAPDRPFGKMMADVHEEEAKSTPPEHADEVGDNVEAEIDKTAKQHDSEVADAIKAAETGSVAEPPAGDTENAGAAESSGQGGTIGESGEIAGSSGEPAPEGDAGTAAAGDTADATGTGGTTPGTGTFGKRNPSAGTSSTGARGAGDFPASPNVKFGKRGSGNGLVDRAGNIRLDLLNTTDDVNKVLQDTAADNKGFMPDRRGVISNGTVLDLADALGLSPEKLNMRKIGEAFNAEQIVAAVKMLIQSAQAVNEAAKSGDGEAYLEARERHKMIQGHVSGITAEAGRALQIFQSLKKVEGMDKAQAFSNFLKDKDNGKTFFQLEEEMKYAAKLDDPSQVSKFVEDSKGARFKDAIVQYYINALISGPFTHLRYAVGNAVNAVWTPVVEIPLSAAYHAITGYEGEDKVRFGEATAQLYALGKGMRDGLGSAFEAMKTGDSPKLPGERMPSGFTPNKHAIPGMIGNVLNTPSHAVAGIHSFFKSVRYEQNIAGSAYRAAINEGLTGTAFEARVAELTVRPTPDMMDAAGKLDPNKMDPTLYKNVITATSDALRELYMAPTDYHSAMAALNRFTDKWLLAKVAAPFLKIGTQITRNAFMERTPLGIFNKDIRANLLGINGETARAMQVGRMAGGISLITMSSMMAAEGMMTGDGPNDPKERAVWLQDHHPNSITIGDVSIPYQGLGSLGMLMRFVANMHETAQFWNGDDGDKFALSALQGLTHSVLDENFMRGVKDMTDAVYHPQEYGTNYLRSFALNWLPFSIGLGQIARATDPYERDVNSMFDAFRDKIPGMSEGLEPKFDRFGRPIMNGQLYSDYANDPVQQKLESLQMGLSRPERRINGVPLTSEQYSMYAQKAGMLRYQALQKLFRSTGFSSKTTEQQVLAVNKRSSQAAEVARSLVKHVYPGITRQAIADKKAGNL